MGRTQKRSKRNRTTPGQTRSNYKDKYAKNEKELEYFLGAVQNKSKYIASLSAQKDILQ